MKKVKIYESTSFEDAVDQHISVCNLKKEDTEELGNVVITPQLIVTPIGLKCMVTIEVYGREIYSSSDD